MQKLSVFIMVTLASFFMASAAQAGNGPPPVFVVLSPATVEAGGSFTVTFNNFCDVESTFGVFAGPGEPLGEVELTRFSAPVEALVFAGPGEPLGEVTVPAGESGELSATAPSEPGEYTVIVVAVGSECRVRGASATLNVTPAAITLPPETPDSETPAPTEGAPSMPAPSTPAPSTPAPSTPAPSTPAPSTPAPSTPAPSTPAPSTPAPAASVEAASPPMLPDTGQTTGGLVAAALAMLLIGGGFVTVAARRS